MSIFSFSSPESVCTMCLAPVAPAFRSPRPVWLVFACLLLFYCGRFTMSIVSFSPLGSVYTMCLAPVAPAFRCPRPVWLVFGCLLLFYCERFITISVSVSSPGIVCTKHKNVSHNDRATDAPEMCCLKLNLNVGLSWCSVLALRKSGGTKLGT